MTTSESLTTNRNLNPSQVKAIEFLKAMWGATTEALLRKEYADLRNVYPDAPYRWVCPFCVYIGRDCSVIARTESSLELLIIVHEYHVHGIKDKGV